MRHRLRILVSTILFVSFVWLLVTALEPLARGRWLGPVPAENLERRFNAAALFYTEVDLFHRGKAEGTDPPTRSNGAADSRARPGHTERTGGLP